LPDAHLYSDEGSDTLGNTSRAVGGLSLPNLGRLGLGNLTAVQGVPPLAPGQADGAYGRLTLVNPGKDTITGHWELAGIRLTQAIRTYPNGFPRELIDALERAIGRGTLGNYAASGTEIIAQLGAEHVRTGKPIVYTSADSVLQIAAHEEVIPVPELYRICEIARALCVGEYTVGRVIARPFVGTPGAFRRTERRHDYSLTPPEPMLLTELNSAGLPVVAIGKITDIYAGHGITESVKTSGNADGIAKTLTAMATTEAGLIMTNLVDFDMLYGHRNDPAGYAAALAEFDRALPALGGQARPDDLLIITADHGCDPTTPSTDHSREYVPILLLGPRVRAGVDLGTRPTLADCGATVAAALGAPYRGAGTSFLNEITAS
jgi:phosphopentomutase